MITTGLVLSGKTIGIIGGGQLSRMVTLSAKEMGFFVGILDPRGNCPASQVADWQIQASYESREAMRHMAEHCDILIYEYENVDLDVLSSVENMVAIPQGTDILAITQDRSLEKAFLESNKINIAPYEVVLNEEDIENAIESIGFPCVLKPARGGYNSNGQVMMYEYSDIASCQELLKAGVCVLEAWIPFERELSVMVARNQQGEVTIFPVSEDIYRMNRLHQSIAPARVSSEIYKEAQRLGKQIAEGIQLIGVMGIEMFLTSSGTIYVNELAPHPHNGGLYSIDACDFSQFDLHVRGICGWPLPKVSMLRAAVTVNVLGKHLQEVTGQIPLQPNWHFHFYGKEKWKPKRKMGHVTILGKTVEAGMKAIKFSEIWD